MPVNIPMMVTWNVELVLLGLVCLSVSADPRDAVLSAALLVGGILCGAAHVVLLALADDRYHHELSLPVLALNLGLALQTFVSSGAVHQAVTSAIACVVLLVTLGMAFATARGATPLVLHHAVLPGVLWPFALGRVRLLGCYAWAAMVCAILVAVLYALRRERAALVVNALLGAAVVGVAAYEDGSVPATMLPLALASVGLCVWVGFAEWEPKTVEPPPPLEEGAARTLSTDVFHFPELKQPSLRVREKFN